VSVTYCFMVAVPNCILLSEKVKEWEATYCCFAITFDFLLEWSLVYYRIHLYSQIISGSNVCGRVNWEKSRSFQCGSSLTKPLIHFELTRALKQHNRQDISTGLTSQPTRNDRVNNTCPRKLGGKCRMYLFVSMLSVTKFVWLDGS
jgi:hypothetical protein